MEEGEGEGAVVVAVTRRTILPPTGPCAACGAPSARYTEKLHVALRDLCENHRDRAQRRRSAHRETPEQGRAWILALVAAEAKGERAPGWALQGKKREPAAITKPTVTRAPATSSAPPTPTPTPASTVAPPPDVIARVAALLRRVGGIEPLERMVDAVEQIRAVA